MNTATQTIDLKRGQNGQTLQPGYFARRNMWDWLFAALVLAGMAWAFMRYGDAMDIYEKWILAGTAPSLIWLGWFWRPLRTLMVVVAALSLLAISLYQTPEGAADLARADQAFLLKYFLSSQSAILWMSVLFFMSTLFYWVGMFSRDGTTFEGLGSRLGLVSGRRAWVNSWGVPSDRRGSSPEPSAGKPILRPSGRLVEGSGWRRECLRAHPACVWERSRAHAERSPRCPIDPIGAHGRTGCADAWRWQCAPSELFPRPSRSTEPCAGSLGDGEARVEHHRAP